MGFPVNYTAKVSQSVHVANNYVLGIWVRVLVVQVLGKYVIIRYLDAYGSRVATTSTFGALYFENLVVWGFLMSRTLIFIQEY